MVTYDQSDTAAAPTGMTDPTEELLSKTGTIVVGTWEDWEPVYRLFLELKQCMEPTLAMQTRKPCSDDEEQEPQRPDQNTPQPTLRLVTNLLCNFLWEQTKDGQPQLATGTGRAGDSVRRPDYVTDSEILDALRTPVSQKRLGLYALDNLLTRLTDQLAEVNERVLSKSSEPQFTDVRTIHAWARRLQDALQKTSSI